MLQFHINLYNEKVFILPPWEEIYQTDSERKQDVREAVKMMEELAGFIGVSPKGNGFRSITMGYKPIKKWFLSLRIFSLPN